jgi:hypothetical protein
MSSNPAQDYLDEVAAERKAAAAKASAKAAADKPVAAASQGAPGYITSGNAGVPFALPPPQPAQQPSTDGSFWSLQGPGWKGGSLVPQSVKDFGDVANEEWTMGSRARTDPRDIVALRQQLADAQKRLGPYGTGLAQFAGNSLNPAQALNLVPYVGGGLAGGTIEGLKSYNRGNENPLLDAARGAVLGELGTIVGNRLTSPAFMGDALSKAYAAAPGVAAGLFGGSLVPGYEGLARGVAGVGGGIAGQFLTPGAEAMKEAITKSAPAVWSAARKPLQALIGAGLLTGSDAGVQPSDFRNLIPGQ